MEEYKSSQKAILLITLLKDIRRFLLILMVPTGFLLLLCTGLFLKFGLDTSVTAFSTYIGNILLGATLISLVFSNSWKALLGLFRPYYKIDNRSLYIYPRSIKIFTDIPYVQVDMNKVKHIWKINSFFDQLFPHVTTFYLGIDVNNNTQVTAYVGNRSINLNNKYFKLMNEALIYQPVICISKGEEFLRNFPGINVESNSALETLSFYLSIL